MEISIEEEILPLQKISLSLPPFLLEEDRAHFSNLSQYSTKASQLVRINNAFINHESIIFNGTSIAKESFVHHFQEEKYRFGSKSFFVFLFKNFFWRLSSINKKESIIWFIDNYSQTYYHWLLEALPRLLLLKYSSNKANKKFTELGIALPLYYKKMNFVVETLDLLGERNITWIPVNKKLKTSKIFLPTQVSIPSNYHPLALKKLKKIILSRIRLDDKKNTLKKYT